MDFEITTHSPADTIALGRKIGMGLRGGEVLAICGPLGSGKTHLIKGIAAGAGAEDYGQVNSPTFVIVNEYVGRFNIYHIDAYRLDSVTEFEQLGFDDFCNRDSVVLIEWADKVVAALVGTDCINIKLDHAGQTCRTLRLADAPDYIIL